MPIFSTGFIYEISFQGMSLEVMTLAIKVLTLGDTNFCVLEKGNQTLFYMYICKGSVD
jgi:hypothetical protein